MKSNVPAQTRQSSQNWDDENDSDYNSEYEPVRPTKIIADTRDETEAGPSYSGALSTLKLVTETPAKKTSSDGLRQSTEREVRDAAGTIGKAKSVPSVGEDGVAAKDSKKNAG